jgi:hydroxymethylglutaryl-CoA reductase
VLDLAIELAETRLPDGIAIRRVTGRAGLARGKEAAMGVGYGKVILLGEHAVVYGRHAIAAPIPLKIKALVEDCDEGIHLLIPRWGVEYRLASNPSDRRSFERPAGVVLDELGLSKRAMKIEVFPEIPRSMGLGGSAAMAVAIVRALDKHFRLGLKDAEVNRLAFESEKMAHGSPSGLDNTLACYGKALVFRAGDPPLVEPLNIREPIPAVIGMTGFEGLTAKTVGKVREAWQQDNKLYERIFDQIDALTLRGIQAIQDNDLPTLGQLMNICQGMLNALQVSTPELEKLCAIAPNSPENAPVAPAGSPATTASPSRRRTRLWDCSDPAASADIAGFSSVRRRSDAGSPSRRRNCS